MPKPGTRQAKRRLNELMVGEVSLVDSAAVGQTFLIAKRFTEEPAAEETTEIAVAKATGDFWFRQYATTKLDLEQLRAKP